jgi:hypothetical protein
MQNNLEFTTLITRSDMACAKNAGRRFARVAILALFSAAFLAGCSSPAIPDRPLPKGWKPLNSFDEQVKVIPLSRDYVFRVRVVDRSLLQLVGRWASDTSIRSKFECDDDFSLPAGLLKRVFADIDDALGELNRVYGTFGVVVRLDEKNALVVQCPGRDVDTGIVRFPRSAPPPPASGDSSRPSSRQGKD